MDVLIKRLPFLYILDLSVFCRPSLQAQRCSVVQYNSLHVEFGYFFFNPLHDWTGLNKKIIIIIISEMISKYT